MGEGLQWFFSTIVDLPGEGLQWGEGLQYNTGHTHRRTDRQTDAGQSYPYVPLCFTGDTKRTASQKAFLNMHEKYSYNIIKIFTSFG